MENESNTLSATEQMQSSQGSDGKKVMYPSATTLLDSCQYDYQRLQENYNKLYDKVNIALAFSGVVLTLMFGSFSFDAFSLFVENMKVWQLLLLILRLVCQCGSIILLLVSTIQFLCLLIGKSVPVFKSEDIRDEALYREQEDIAALWLIDKYTKITNMMRPIILNKQRKFDKTLVMLIIGIITYAVSILLEKGGY